MAGEIDISHRDLLDARDELISIGQSLDGHIRAFTGEQFDPWGELVTLVGVPLQVGHAGRARHLRLARRRDAGRRRAGGQDVGHVSRRRRREHHLSHGR
ncbi:hypothetical protein ACIBHX_01290 [Nonomuraea sp. NPDC050536]|uniref:hypothetical protein n=1 Tax=Nonomuraea sp. NPDC050536 TaxID=3364366 RepID=UPI0037CC278D